MSFSWRLILAPLFVLNYVAAHEVAHLREMNHSRRFWRLVDQLVGREEADEAQQEAGQEVWLERLSAAKCGLEQPAKPPKARRFGGLFLFNSEAKETKSMTMCPECDGQLSIPEDAVQGEIIPCPDCGAELEVLSLNPATVGLAPEVQEDWGE